MVITLRTKRACTVIYILAAGRSWNCGFRPRRAFKSCGSCVVQRGSSNAQMLAHACFANAKRVETMWFPCGSNTDDVVSAPSRLSNHVVPPRLNVVPTMRKCWHMFVWQILRSSWPTAGLLLDAGRAHTKGGQVMFRPQPLHQLPSLGSGDEALQQLRPSWLAAGLMLNAGSAQANGGQVMCPHRPLHQLPAATVLAQAPEWCVPADVRRRPESKISSSLPVGHELHFTPICGASSTWVLPIATCWREPAI